MSEHNGTYRIRTVVGTDNPDYVSNLNIPLEQDYDTFEIMSLKIKSTDSYRLHNSNHGVIAGRVIANNGFGIPNAKISIFIDADSADEQDITYLYPYSSTASKNDDNVRYNLLPDNKVDGCHQAVGTFPNKTYLLENDILLEVYDKYYSYSTRTNNSGDYLLIGIPEGSHTLHMDLDLSDCGILSQRPRDFVYKGYTIEQFENANMFKSGTNLDSLSQIFSQDISVTVNPFWGNADMGENIGITRADFDIPFKFETTCVFMGCVVSDQASNGISKKCVPTNSMGRMDELTTGEGRIEMIRKTPGGGVEEFQIKGTQLIDGNGIWCYQIPMNLDYMRTDEYGRMVPTDNPERGVATRARVRFRVSMQESDKAVDNYYRAKVLVPNNPQNTDTGHEDYDYNFGTYTREDSYRDLLWNNVYTVKSYIPRFSRSQRWKTERFTGIKNCNIYGQNNPIPYNNIRIKLPLIFTILCVLIKSYVYIVGILNYLIQLVANFLWKIAAKSQFAKWYSEDGNLGKKVLKALLAVISAGIIPFIAMFSNLAKKAKEMRYIVLKEGLCPDLDTWYFAPQKPRKSEKKKARRQGLSVISQTLNYLETQTDPIDEDDDDDEDEVEEQVAKTSKIDTKSIDEESDEKEAICITKNTDYLISCIEMNLAQEYKVINFDFYNDWINGMLYIPRWMRQIKKKRKYWLFGKKVTKVKSCMDDTSIFSKSRKFGQLCALQYGEQNIQGIHAISKVDKTSKEKNNYHKKKGKKLVRCFGKKNGGLVHEATTLANEYVYYLKPCEWKGSGNSSQRLNLFATDIVLLGSLNDCDVYGTPQAFKYLSSSTYKMPTNLALTNMETDGALYADGKDSLCTTSDYYDGVQKLDEGNATLKQEIEFYNGKNNYDASKTGENYERLEYGEEGEEESDTIALTEASGIAWNYTGPGQGDINKGILYYPGGHFLGISCVNSQTNKKSCINLSRICEVGVTMSQRQENVRKITSGDDGTNVKFHYTYNVPTGLIAGDEVVDIDVRSMLASMNQHRLIANKTNPDTGYKTYDFLYRRPRGFNGEMAKFVGTNESSYNENVNETQEEDLTFARISKGRTRPDFDSEETSNTQRHTLEDASLDYYLYRMGFDYDVAKKYRMMKRRFAYWGDNNKFYLPQYENSFYFYFGLHDGSTALDEFNKQFFAQCDSSSIVRTSSEIILTPEKDICKNTCSITVKINGMAPNYIVAISLITDGVQTVISSEKTDKDVYTSGDLEYGTYRVEVTDSDGKYMTEVITIECPINATVVAHNFNLYADGTPGSLNQWYKGGYITVSDILIDGSTPTGGTITVNVPGASVPTQTYTPPTLDDEYADNENNKLQFFVGNTGSYTVYIKYECEGGAASGNGIAFNTYKIYDTKSVSLYMGDLDSDISVVGGGIDKEDVIEWYNPGWWAKINGGALKNNTEDKRWALKHFLFVQTDAEEGKRSSSSSVDTPDVRTLFGEPQNKTGFSGEVACESDNTKKYVLSDTGVYWETLSNSGLKAAPYGSMAFAGSIVGGEYCGYMENGMFTNTGKKAINWGKAIGVVGKDKYTEEIEYFKVSGGKPDTESDYSGVFFPVYRYPSIYRPFYGDMTFFSYSDAKIEKEDDSNGNFIINTAYYQDNSRLYGYLHNGVTYNNEWGLVTICKKEWEGTLTATTTDDVNGIQESAAPFANASNRPQLVGKNETDSPWIIENGVSEFSYKIMEGTPSGREDIGCEASGKTNFAFLDNISYSMIEGSNQAIFFPVSENVEESDNETDNIVSNYYIISKSLLPIEETNNLLVTYNTTENDEGETIPDISVFYTLGRYNENAEYDNLGTTTVVTLGLLLSTWLCTYTITTKNGKVEAQFILPMEGAYDAWMDLVDAGKVGVTPICQMKTDIYNNDKIAKLFECSQEPDNKMKKIKVNGKIAYSFNPDTESIIGLGVAETGYYGRLRHMMLYPYLAKGADVGLDGIPPYISVTPNPITMSRDGETKSVIIDSNVDWELSSVLPSWLTLDVMSGKAGTISIAITAEAGSNSDASLVFTESNTESEELATDTLIVKQSSGGGSGGGDGDVKNGTYTANTTKYEGTISVTDASEISNTETDSSIINPLIKFAKSGTITSFKLPSLIIKTFKGTITGDKSDNCSLDVEFSLRDENGNNIATAYLYQEENCSGKYLQTSITTAFDVNQDKTYSLHVTYTALVESQYNHSNIFTFDCETEGGTYQYTYR